MKWEYFRDPAYYDMYAVRPIGDTDFNSGLLFHLLHSIEAKKLCTYLNRTHTTTNKELEEGDWSPL